MCRLVNIKDFALELIAKLDTMPFSSAQYHGNTGCTNPVKIFISI